MSSFLRISRMGSLCGPSMPSWTRNSEHRSVSEAMTSDSSMTCSNSRPLRSPPGDMRL